MGIFNRKKVKEDIKTKGFYLPFFGNGVVNVSNENALKYSAVYSAVRLLTDTVSTLPLHLYKKDGDKRYIVNSHPLAQFIDKPNPEVPTNVLIESLHGHLEMYGKAYAEIVHDPKTGFPHSIHPINPHNIVNQINKDTGELEYRFTPTGQIIPRWKMFHLIGYGWDGLNSYSPITLAKRSLEIGVSAEEFNKKFFEKGTNVGGVITTDQELDDDEYERFMEQIKQTYSGLQNSHGLMLLENGMQYTPVKINLVDAQFLESRKFQIAEIARWFGVKPHMISELSNATYSNIEQQSIEAVRYTFRPRVVRWESALNELIPPHLRNEYYFKFNMEGILRGETATRYQAYRMALQDGWMSADEVRAMEDMNPIEDGTGKFYMVPLNMVNRNTLIEKPVQTEQKVQENVERTAESVKDKIIEARRVSVSIRNKEIEAYRGMLTKKIERIASKEISSIREQIPKIKEGANEFLTTIESIYKGLREDIKQELRPLFNSMAERILPIIQDETGLENDVINDVEKFVADYVETFSIRYTKSNEGQIKKIVKESDYSELIDKIEERLNEWEKKEVNKVVDNEIVRGGNAITRTAYAALGIQKLIWHTSGNSCPYCNQLEGRVVGIEQPFVSKNTNIETDDRPTLNVTSNTFAPPLHQGCTCSISSY